MQFCHGCESTGTPSNKKDVIRVYVCAVASYSAEHNCNQKSSMNSAKVAPVPHQSAWEGSQ